MRVGGSGGVGGGGFDTEKMANRYLQKRERLGPQLPAISAGVVLDSCKKPAGARRRQRRAGVSA